MDKSNTIDEIKKIAAMLSKDMSERKAFVLMPTLKGVDLYEVSESLAQHCIYAEVSRKRSMVETEN